MGLFFTRPAKVKRFDYTPLYYDKEAEEKEKRRKVVIANYARGNAGKRFKQDQHQELNHQQMRLERARKFIIIAAVILLVLAFVYAFRLTNLFSVIPN